MDGTVGLKGLITHLCDKHLTEKVCKKAIVYTCGPNPMMKNVSKILEKKNVLGFASLEEMMACGIGICQGCVVKIKGEYKKACADGPVFNLKDIEW